MFKFIMIFLIALALPCLSFADDNGILLAAISGDVVVVNINDKVYPVRLLGVLTPNSSAFTDVVRGSYQISQLQSFMDKTIPSGEKVRLEYDKKKEDTILKGYLAAYVWLSDGRMLNEELIKGGFAVPAKEGKYYERFINALKPQKR